MKKAYIGPQIAVEMFTPNTYVAACGDHGTVYNFECNAGSKGHYYNVYLNGPDGIAHTSDDILWWGMKAGKRFQHSGSYSPCSKKHQASADSGFSGGYMREQIRYGYGHVVESNKETSVIVWTENGTNVHCTTNLNMSTWETAKS